MDNAVTSNAIGGTAGPVPSLSLVSLFSEADLIVKAVMVLLLVLSFWSWAIMFDKWLKLRRLRKSADAFEETFWSGGSIDVLYDRIGNRPDHPMAAVFTAAMLEWRRSFAKGVSTIGGLRAGLNERIDKIMAIAITREMERLERFTPFLATVGSIAPFIGLFGTVWGIMNSFESIAQTKNTSLAVVAPGIAESLFTTALGLVAAIPAVWGYNQIATSLGRYSNRLDNFAGEFSAILARQVEDKAA